MDVIGVVEQLDRSRTADVMANQLIRSATSVAANYRAVCRARSKADFANKLGIVEEEVDESAFWLEMLVDCRYVRLENATPLLKEAGQLLRIIAASRITARNNLRKTVR
jgi:four helix bundle protein